MMKSCIFQIIRLLLIIFYYNCSVNCNASGNDVLRGFQCCFKPSAADEIGYATTPNLKCVHIECCQHCMEALLSGHDSYLLNAGSLTSLGCTNSTSDKRCSELCRESDSSDKHDGEPCAFKPSLSPHKKYKLKIYTNIMLCTSLILLFTVCTFLIVWKTQKLYNWLQFSYILISFISQVYISMSQLWLKTLYKKIPSEWRYTFCQANACLLYFCFVSTFFWFTSMLFYAWRSFRIFPKTMPRGSGWKFFRYASWSILIPLALAVINLPLDKWINSGESFNFNNSTNCHRHFTTTWELVYYYGPIGCLQIVDTIFFLNMFYIIRRSMNESRLAELRNSSSQEANLTKIALKLFVQFRLLGFLWVVELVPIIVLAVQNENTQIWALMYIVFNLAVSLKAFCIFFVFICNRKMLQRVQNALC